MYCTAAKQTMKVTKRTTRASLIRTEFVSTLPGGQSAPKLTTENRTIKKASNQETNQTNKPSKKATNQTSLPAKQPNHQPNNQTNPPATATATASSQPAKLMTMAERNEIKHKPSRNEKFYMCPHVQSRARCTYSTYRIRCFDAV